MGPKRQRYLFPTPEAMEAKARIIKNTLFLLAGNVIEQMISFVLVIAVARNLGDAGLGEYAFVFSFIWVVVILMNPGLDYLLLKEISRDEAKTSLYASNMLFIKLALGGMALVITFLITWFLPKNPVVKLSIGIASISFFLNGFGAIFFQILQARERMEFNAMAKIAERLTALVLGLFFLSRGFSLPWFVFSLFVSGLIRDGLSYFISRKFVRLKYHFDFTISRSLLRESLPFFLALIFAQIYFRADTVILSLIKGDQVTGWYSAAYKFVEILRFMPFLLITAILPPMSKAFKENAELLKDIFLRTFRYLFLTALPVCFFVFVAAPQIIRLFYGPSFVASIIVLRILIWGVVFSFLNILFINFLNIVDRQKIVMKVTGFIALCNILLNLGLIPFYSQSGAAISLIVSEGMSFIILSYQVREFYRALNLLLQWLPIFLASLGMGILVFFFRFLPLWVLVPLGGISYIFFLILFKGIRDQDREIIREFVKLVR
jgi:O-antigen/teichoic acid export membrane protein